MSGRQDLFDESMRLGHSAAWDLEWERSIEFYRKALAEFPENPTALTSLALALLETGQLEEALTVYQRAARGTPNDPIPIEKSAEIFERLGRVPEAVEVREKAADMHLRRKDVNKAVENWNHIARLSPGNLPARSRLALTYERMGRRQEAVVEYLSVAAILQSGGKVDRAKEAVQRSMAILPGEPEAARAMRMLQQGKPLAQPAPPRGATAPLRMAQVQEYLKADEEPLEEEETEMADPEISAQREALTMLAAMLFDEPGDGTGELPSLSMSAMTSGKTDGDRGLSQPPIFRYLSGAIDLQTRGHKRQAIKEFAKAIESGLDHPAAHYNLGLLLKEVHDYDEAKKHLAASLGHPELGLGANLALGRIARERGEVATAARYLLQALRLADTLSVSKGQSTQLDQFYGTIMASQADGNEEQLENIVESTLNFLSGPEWLQRVRQARKQLGGQEDGATVVPIAEMLAVGGTDKVVQAMGRINVLAARGLYASAIEEALLVLDQAPVYLGLHQRIAEILIESGRVETGFAKLRMIAEVHRVRGESRQAAEIYRRLLENAPLDIEARAKLIELLVQQDRVDEALQQYVVLAEMYRQMADLESARKSLGNGLRLAKRMPGGERWQLKILHQMGDIDVSRLDPRRALTVYGEICQLAPEDEVARYNVIDLNLRLDQEDQAARELDSYLEYLVKNTRSSEALTMLEELAQEHPGKQVLHACLAEAYRAAGRKADAIAQYDALGEIQLDAGQIKDAAHSIQAIIDLNPPDIEGYRELLRNLKAGQ